MNEPLLLKPEQAAAAIGISRSKLFELIAAGQIETVQIGRSRRIPHAALGDYVSRLRSAQAALSAG
jgi:excisionase family DNA binding protein